MAKWKKKYDFDSIIWEKCLTKEEDDGNTSSSKNEGKNSNDTNYIYQIKLRDYECYLKTISISNPFFGFN